MMNRNELLLRAKLSQQFKYKTMLELSEQLVAEEVSLADLTLSTEIRTQLVALAHAADLTAQISKLQSECTIISYFDDNYPQKLREIYRPPLLLFCKGNVKLLQSQAVGIVGARNNSGYSAEVLTELIPELVRNHYTIVSGLARGVDCLAHQLTLQNHGATIAVLGNGLNQYYPKCNQAVQQQIAQHGLLVSEYLPDTPPARFRFPERNRIIAGLVEDLLVTEAKIKSGSLITANVALQENRNVYALPGPITSALSAGTNELIAAGATPLLNFSIDNFRQL